MKTYKDNDHVKGVQYYYSQYSIADQHKPSDPFFPKLQRKKKWAGLSHFSLNISGHLYEIY